MAQQLSMFAGEGPRIIADDERGRIVYLPGVLAPWKARGLFEFALSNAPWSSETMWMYDKMVDVPRLVAAYPAGAELPPELAEARTLVERATGERFNAISLNYYRDERDSVAWHSDHLRDMIPQPAIALLSVGATRQMLIRSKQTPRTTYAVDLEPGSVLVMSGRSQEFWEHTVPKVSRPTDARISIAFRQRPSV